MTIRVNRILSRPKNIAGIPANVFLPIGFFNVVVGIFGCLMFALPPLLVGVFCLTVNIVWAILVAKGVWRFLGTFWHPPRYYRANIRYQPLLQSLLDHDRHQPQSSHQKRRNSPRKRTGKNRPHRKRI